MMINWADFCCFLYYGSAIFTIFAIALFICVKAITTPYPIIQRYDEEKVYLNPLNSNVIKFPSIDDDPTIDLSVIVPAYNEEQRLPLMLNECLEYLEKRTKENTKFTYEIIIVSDGSTDTTVTVANNYVKKYGIEKVRVMELIKNRGKGGAVRLGMLSARGKNILFADADGASKFSELKKLEFEIPDDWKHESIVIGSRAHLEDEAIASRSFFRTILMHGFHLLVWLFAVRKIRDTQCGFKLFTREAARVCFSIMHVERWAFDVELLFIAQYLHIPITEVAIQWTEIEGSKLTPIWSWLQMGRDLFLIWFRYAIGAWKLQRLHKN